jgi:short-subunit dehydrogenase
MTEAAEEKAEKAEDAARPGAEAGGPRRRALITGASVGIGRAFAERLARDQYDLVIVARDAERLGALAKSLVESRGRHVEVLPADLTRNEDLRRVEARVEEDTLDLLVNNAGFGSYGRFAELDREREEEEIRLNVVALVRLTHAALPGMLRRGHGAILNVSSLAGEGPAPYNATYGATKAFVTSFSQALHEEVRGSGVRVQALLPGFTRTEFQERAGIDTSQVPGFAWMTAETVVEASLRSLERGDALCIPGVGNRVVAGAERLLPRPVLRRVAGLMMRRGLD